MGNSSQILKQGQIPGAFISAVQDVYHQEIFHILKEKCIDLKIDITERRAHQCHQHKRISNDDSEIPTVIDGEDTNVTALGGLFFTLDI